MLTIPRTWAEITPEWLTDALGSSGALDEGCVASVTAEAIGEGQGFIGELARLRLSYEGGATGPATLIAKLPTLDEHRANLSRYGRFNEREARFYRDLAALSRVRAPRCYHNGMDLDAQRFVLLLEDMAPRRVGDQMAGCSAEDARAAVLAIAPLHAAWWQHERLGELEWMPRLDGVHPTVEGWWQQTWEQAAARAGDRLPDPVRHIGERFGANAMRALRLLGEGPQTIAHGDYRLDNLFFGEGEMAVGDWQLASRGAGVFDVAFFLSGNVEPSVRRAEEERLLRAWHDRLVDEGVRGYSLAQAQDGYRLATLFSLTFTLIVLNMLGSSPQRSEALFDAWFARCTAAVADLDVGELLG